MSRSSAVGCTTSVVAIAALAASHAWGAVTCGMIVEDRIVLDRDLRCPPPALIVRNPRTVVQLNGHTIESLRSCRDEAGTGIVIEATADRAQILGPGTVRGFQMGITIDGTAQAQVRDLRITDSCAIGLMVRHTNATRARDLVFDANGDGTDLAAAVRVEQARRFALLESEVFLNDAGSAGAVVDLRSCEGCRLGGNRIVANRGAGIRLDGETHASEVERNLVLGHHPSDVVDQGSDNLTLLNGFERGDGVEPPRAWPLLGLPASPAPGVAGCGTLNVPVEPHATVTLPCPQDTGLRAVRNSVVAYRLLNVFNTTQVFRNACDPVTVRPASESGGGAVTCRNPDSVYGAMLEITCCLN